MLSYDVLICDISMILLISFGIKKSFISLIVFDYDFIKRQ
jgi:hypothetical protein